MLRHALVVACFLLAGAASSIGKSIPNPPLDLDHFLCYVPTQSTVFTMAVRLQDQFDFAADKTETIEDLRIARLCAPVKKYFRNGNHFDLRTTVLRPDAYLTLFQMGPQPSTARRVSIRNQFVGDQILQVRQAETLAVPTGRKFGDATNLPAIPIGLDHFKCYNASGMSINRMVGLVDDFNITLLNSPYEVKVLAPIAFCNPVEKTKGLGVDAVVTPITNPIAHLVCYAITQVQQGGRVAINNQFGFGVVDVNIADTLCVPSFKLSWSVIPVPPNITQ